MNDILHITSGDSVGGSLAKAGLAGEILVWHDILYEGPGARAGRMTPYSMPALSFLNEPRAAD